MLLTARAHHPHIAALLRANGPLPLRRCRDRDLFLFLARIATDQQLSLAAARAIWARLAALAASHGRTLQELCTARNAPALRGCGLSAGKVRALLRLRQALLRGELSARRVMRSDAAGIAAQITALPGFGPWSADMVAIFYAARPDVWPDGDAAVARGMTALLGRRRSAARAADLYRPHRSYLALHIWRGYGTGAIPR